MIGIPLYQGKHYFCKVFSGNYGNNRDTSRQRELGTVKVTVGVKYRKQNDKDDDRPKKIEYGISVLDPGEELVKTGTEEKRNRKDKRKASHKK